MELEPIHEVFLKLMGQTIDLLTTTTTTQLASSARLRALKTWTVVYVRNRRDHHSLYTTSTVNNLEDFHRLPSPEEF